MAYLTGSIWSGEIEFLFPECPRRSHRFDVRGEPIGGELFKFLFTIGQPLTKEFHRLPRDPRCAGEFDVPRGTERGSKMPLVLGDDVDHHPAAFAKRQFRNRSPGLGVLVESHRMDSLAIMNHFEVVDRVADGQMELRH